MQKEKGERKKNLCSKMIQGGTEKEKMKMLRKQLLRLSSYLNCAENNCFAKSTSCLITWVHKCCRMRSGRNINITMCFFLDAA